MWKWLTRKKVEAVESEPPKTPHPLDIAMYKVLAAEFPDELVYTTLIVGISAHRISAITPDGVWVAELVQGRDCIYRVRLEEFTPTSTN